jgi:flagellar biosynthesis/type III secretory pathway protein FliH
LNHKEPVETEIPWLLHIQIIKLQGKLESSYMEACIEAAKLIDANGPEFEKAVATKARRLENSSLMKKINKSRKSWQKKGHDKGLVEGRKQGHAQAETEYKVTYPCKICHKPIVMYPENQDYKALQSLMMNAGWGHSTCHEKKR